MHKTCLTLPILLLALVACGSDEEPTETQTSTEVSNPSDSGGDPAKLTSNPATPSETAHQFSVECGCALDEIGHCGEYIEVDGKFVELNLPVDLGAMPFCGKSGLQGLADGEVEDGVFVASTFALMD